MKLLIIEDELSLQNALKKGFYKLGYVVDVASTGIDALEMYFSSYYDVIILDLNLPLLDGLEVLKEIRKENQEIKIIILSARSEVEDKILGLDSGANDYLSKPFHFNELEARVRSLLRRDFSLKDTIVNVLDLSINTALKRVSRKDEVIPLTKKEYGILEYLVINKGRVVSAQELIEHVWDSGINEFTNAFKVHIATLRKKIPFDIIKNVRGEGYYVE